jgi:hypothetical protein
VTQPQYLGIYGRSSYAGLFGTTGSAARIAHVGLDNASIKASGGSTNSAGALVGWNSGAIVQSYATGNATAEGKRQQLRGRAGGENRQRQHQPKLCHGQRHGGGYTNSAGALVGVNIRGNISQSYATGSATAEGGGYNNSAGALVGENLDGSIRQSYATGTPRPRMAATTTTRARWWE